MSSTLDPAEPSGSRGARAAIVLALACATVAGLLQAARDRAYPPAPPAERLLYVPSGAILDRLVLGYDALAADVYWIRTIQHFGGTRRATAGERRYELLYPLLDITTTLDPHFTIAYRFGATFLAEPPPGGPGRADLAEALLRKGLGVRPDYWPYMQDIGFVRYWWLHDYRGAAAWFDRASRVPGAPWWLRTLAAVTLAQGGNRDASRTLWQQVLERAEDDWLRQEARRRLAQLAALDDLDHLAAVLDAHVRKGGRVESWSALVRAGLLPAVPVDPAGVPYVLDPVAGELRLSVTSPLFPLPEEPPAARPPA